ncbi:tetratricopeptide repeat protein [Saccharothrix australiensis]|uniref:tetratricopeptide repeat protein n=1 Tax=Saccharothrix australiensis TaxID=2072 RepID=UPI0011C36CC6|nr:tetratricopeptide repeat protein [Saccharothrix australiensis]
MIALLSPGQEAPNARIAKALWPNGPSKSVSDVTRELREVLPEVRQKLQVHGRCVLQLNPDDVDILRVRRNVTAAKRTSGRERLDLLRTAVAEWQGLPLMGPEWDGYDLDAERELLDNEWLSTVIDFLHALQGCNEDLEFDRELRKALDQWPAAPALIKLKAMTMINIGRPSEAVQFVQDCIRDHGDDHGQLEELMNELTPPDSTRLEPVVPNQLPGQHVDLHCRGPLEQELDDRLLGANERSAAVVVLHGMAGVGKSQLARSWAGSRSAHFDGGTLYAELRGFGPKEAARPQEVLEQFLVELGVASPVRTLDGMISTFRTATAGRNLLVVLDNARDADQVRPLLPGIGCTALITSRMRLDGLVVHEGAVQCLVEPFDENTARDVLGRLARLQSDGNPLVADIARFTGGLALALAIVAATIRTRPEDDGVLRGIRDGLREQRTRLDTLKLAGDENLDMRAVLSYSYEHLSADAKSLLCLIAHHPGPTIGSGAISAIAESAVRARLGELSALNLIEEPEFERFRVHDLIRTFALEQIDTLDSQARDRTSQRLLSHLLQNAWTCDQVLVPGRRLPVGISADLPVVRVATIGQAIRWFEQEQATISRAVDHAVEIGDDHHTWLLPTVFATYLWHRNHYHEAERILEHAGMAVERLRGDGGAGAVPTAADEAFVYRLLAGSRRGMRSPKARGAQARALQLSRDAGDRYGVAYGHIGLAVLRGEEKDFAGAVSEYRLALEAFRELGERLGEADALSGLAMTLVDLGQLTEADEHVTAALAIYEQVPDINARANAMVVLGRVHAEEGNLGRAAAVFDTAVAEYRKLDRANREAPTQVRLAQVLLADHRAVEGQAALERARELYSALADEKGLAEVENLTTTWGHAPATGAAPTTNAPGRGSAEAEQEKTRSAELQ